MYIVKFNKLDEGGGTEGLFLAHTEVTEKNAEPRKVAILTNFIENATVFTSENAADKGTTKMKGLHPEIIPVANFKEVHVRATGTEDGIRYRIYKNEE